jgi:probable HAF family extracellular repeat protein
MIPRAFRSWIAALVLGWLAVASAAAQTYTATDLGSLGTFETFAFALNDSRRVAGYSYVSLVPGPGFTRHAFLWQNGQMQDLGLLPGGTYSWATDINEAGQVCGHADDASGAQHPVLYRNGVLEDLGSPGRGGEARGMNDLAEIAGYYVTDASDIHATFWSDATGLVDLTAETKASQGLAEDVNGHTQVVGWSHGTPCGGPSGFIGPRATLWENPGTGWTATDLGTLGSACFSHAYDINEAGQVVGESGGFGGTAVLWQKSSTGAWQIQSLGTLGGTYSQAHAINNRGQVVGQAQISGGVYHAFLWQCGSLIDLNSRIPAGSGWVLNAATGINDLGEIVGYGKLNGGNYRGFLLRPSTNTSCCRTLVAEPAEPANPVGTVD